MIGGKAAIALKAAQRLGLEQQRVTLNGGMAVLLSGAILALCTWWLPMFVAFPVGRADGLMFAARANVIPLLVLMVAVRRVARIRFISPEDNRGSAYDAPSSQLAVPAAFLQNTLEQTVLFVLASSALATLGTPEAMAFISAGAFLFLVGRITFLLGYPKGAGGRAFGMVMTTMPALGATVWVICAMVLGL